MSKFTKKCLAILTLSEQSVRMAIHFFVNFDVFKSQYLSKTSLINTKLGNFVNLGVLFLSMWIISFFFSCPLLLLLSLLLFTIPTLYATYTTITLTFTLTIYLQIIFSLGYLHTITLHPLLYSTPQTHYNIYLQNYWVIDTYITKKNNKVRTRPPVLV